MVKKKHGKARNQRDKHWWRSWWRPNKSLKRGLSSVVISIKWTKTPLIMKANVVLSLLDM